MICTHTDRFQSKISIKCHNYFEKITYWQSASSFPNSYQYIAQGLSDYATLEWQNWGTHSYRKKKTIVKTEKMFKQGSKHHINKCKMLKSETKLRLYFVRHEMYMFWSYFLPVIEGQDLVISIN